MIKIADILPRITSTFYNESIPVMKEGVFIKKIFVFVVKFDELDKTVGAVKSIDKIKSETQKIMNN